MRSLFSILLLGLLWHSQVFGRKGYETTLTSVWQLIAIGKQTRGAVNIGYKR